MVSELRTIGVVTGCRADYGPLLPVLRALSASATLRPAVIAAGAHLSSQFGMTVEKIEEDGFSPVARVEVLPEGDSEVAVAEAMGRGVAGFARAFDGVKPDAVLVLGDRYEILAAASAASLLRLPIVHLCGGDVTEGAIDDVIRHAITKMAHLHFATNEQSAARIRQMGEDPARVFVTGSSAIDFMKTFTFFDRVEIARRLGAALLARTLLVTFHPVTLASDNGIGELRELLDALGALPADVGMVFTTPNADAGGRHLRDMIAEFVEGRPGAILRDSLGQALYLSLLKEADAVVGNSSSGLSEAPSVGTVTVNVGERQAGRLQGLSVINCEARRDAIGRALARALGNEAFVFRNPYGEGGAASRIVRVLEGIGDFRSLTRKTFHELKVA